MNKAGVVNVLWWRKRTVNWPAILNVKMPNKFYRKKTKIVLYRLMNRKGERVTTFFIKKPGNVILETESAEVLLEFLCANSYPTEIIEYFIKMI